MTSRLAVRNFAGGENYILRSVGTCYHRPSLSTMTYTATLYRVVFPPRNNNGVNNRGKKEREKGKKREPRDLCIPSVPIRESCVLNKGIITVINFTIEKPLARNSGLIVVQFACFIIAIVRLYLYIPATDLVKLDV